MTLKVNGRNFVKDKKTFFYLADTCWSAFTNIREDDWHYYLQYRKRQGYNVLQINILPQWDASETELDYKPYELKENGGFDFTKIKDSYFEHAAHMCEIAKEYGFELALVVLWCNYVPDTWASNMQQINIMPYECIEEYVTKVTKTFHQFEPIYVISGDTDLNEETSQAYYLKVSDILNKLAPDNLKTMHVRGRLMEIPEKFIERIDFYMFQSGHNAQPENLCMTYRMPEYFMKHYPKKTLINAEPCYEQMGYSHQMYGRHHSFQIRRAAWQSLLSGASAGITYGAAGIYSWHTYGKVFGKQVGEGFDHPNPWQMAIHYSGAWDYSDIRIIFEMYHLMDLVPCQELLVNNTEEIRVAYTGNKEKMLIYVPENTNVYLKIPESDLYRQSDIIDLSTRHCERGSITYNNGMCCLGMHTFEHDVLYILSF